MKTFASIFLATWAFSAIASSGIAQQKPQKKSPEKIEKKAAVTNSKPAAQVDANQAKISSSEKPKNDATKTQEDNVSETLIYTPNAAPNQQPKVLLKKTK